MFWVLSHVQLKYNISHCISSSIWQKLIECFKNVHFLYLPYLSTYQTWGLGSGLC